MPATFRRGVILGLVLAATGCALLTDYSGLSGGEPLNDGGELDVQSILDAGNDGSFTLPDGGCLACGGNEVVDVALGLQFGCALLGNGNVWCWGRNNYAQLGSEPMNGNMFAPAEVLGFDGGISIRAGQNFVCVLRKDETVWCWGSNADDQLGHDNSTDDPVCSAGTLCAWHPMPAENVSTAQAIGTGFATACAVTSISNVLCWGNSDNGDLGALDAASLPPQPIPNATNDIDVAGGNNAMCVFRSVGSGRISCWGDNSSGQLGHVQRPDAGDTDAGDPNAFDVQYFLPDGGYTIVNDFHSLAFANTHGCGIVDDGGIMCWGIFNGPHSPPEDGSVALVDTTIEAQQIAAGDSHSCALDVSGNAYCWGNPAYFATGISDAASWIPTPVPVGIAGKTIRCGGHQSAVITADGSVWQWGEVAGGGDAGIRPVPTRIDGLP